VLQQQAVVATWGSGGRAPGGR